MFPLKYRTEEEHMHITSHARIQGWQLAKHHLQQDLKRIALVSVGYMHNCDFLFLGIPWSRHLIKW